MPYRLKVLHHTQINISKARRSHNSLGEVGIGEVGRAEVGASEASTVEVEIAEVRSAEVGTAEVGIALQLHLFGESLPEGAFGKNCSVYERVGT